MSERIEIVSAAIVWRGRLLLIQRAPHSPCPWMWATPGGRVEPGESHEDALIREMREELVVEVAVAERVYVAEVDPPSVEKPIRLTCYRAHLLSGEKGRYTAADGVIGFGWFDADTLRRFSDLAPADEANRAVLRELLL